MKKIISLLFAFILSCSVFAFFGCGNKPKVVIATSTEEYNATLLKERLTARFPDYEIVISIDGTASIAANAIEAGERVKFDIVYAEEDGYLSKMQQAGVLAPLNNRYDFSVFTDDSYSVQSKLNYIPSIRTGGAVIINKTKLQERNLSVPTSYADLLDDEYKVDGLIALPKITGGTGFMFYAFMMNKLGDDAGLAYYNSLFDNGAFFTSGGSGPITRLINGESCIAFGMISQAVEKINGGNTNLEILTFEGEKTPFNMYSTAVMKGREENQAVWDVMDYIYSSYIDESCSVYYPEQILKNKTYSVPNFPQVEYANMAGTLARREELVGKWTH